MALPPAPSLGEFSSSVLSSKPSEEHQLDPRLPRPTIVLVHAAWHGPETFSLIVPGLEHAGYSVTAVTLPSSNQTPAVPDISEDVKIVRNAVTSNLKLGKDVVLVMHSYGSMSGCEAMRGVAQDIANMNREKHVGIRVGKVVKLAFICGLILPLGGAAFGMERGYKGPPGFVCVDDLISVLDGPQRFYSDLPLDLANRWNACIKPHSRLALASPATYPAYFHFPATYLLCTQDKAILPKIQRMCAAQAKIRDVVEIEAGHCPQISQPKVVEKFIRRAAGELEPML